MLKQGTFINKKFYSMLFFNLLTWGTDAINTMVDAILGGNQLGEVTLSAVSIVSPLYAIITVVSLLFAPGCSILYGIYTGKFDKENAYKTAGWCVSSSLIAGLLVSIALFLLKMPFLNYYNCTGMLFEQASAYYNWFVVLAFIEPVYYTIYYLSLAEGAAFYIMLGTVAMVGGNVVLSYILCQTMGISGLGLATCISSALGALLNAPHFLTKKSGVHLKLSLDFGIVKNSIILSGHRTLNYIFIALVDIIMNKIVINTLGSKYIAAYSVINLILAIFITSGGTYDTCQGICTSYLGEKNNYGTKAILMTSMKVVFIVGFVMMVALLIFAPSIPKIYGLTSPEIISVSVRATRILALSSIPFAIAYFGYNLYSSLGKPLLSIAMAFLYNFFCPLLLSIPLAFVKGFDGISIGMSASSFLVIALFVWFIRSKYGKEGFPWYLEETGEETVGYDLYVTEDTIPEIRDKVKAELDKHGYEIDNLELLIEELYTRIYEKNPGKTVCSECTLLFGKNHVRIIVRDNGVIFNFLDENNLIESLNAHVLNSLLERTEDKQYLITTSFNRNGFVFEK